MLTQEELSVGLPLDVARDEDEIEDEECAGDERHDDDDPERDVALDLPLRRKGRPS